MRTTLFSCLLYREVSISPSLSPGCVYKPLPPEYSPGHTHPLDLLPSTHTRLSTERLTDRCKTLPCPKTSFAGGNNTVLVC